ncbi:MAG TPA: hypothetical protein VLD37_02565 [Candidatus Bilamarchaeum sp.]|nr:hypothetical protein [Candidatus Bilamarchaeum sp.]
MKYLALVIAGLLLIGCTQSPAQPAQNTSKPAETSPPAQPAPSGGNDSQPPAPPSQPAPSQYAGKTFPELVALGIPLQCEISYTYQGKPGSSNVYFKGGAEIRVETVGGAGMSQCTRTISIVRDTRVYVGCDGKQVMPSCDWFRSDYDPARPGESSTFNFYETSPSQISCRDWAYDKTVFATAGNVCHI